MRKVIVTLAAVFVLSLVSACTTTDTAPADPHLTGQWRLDPGASDDTEAKVAAAVSRAEAKLRHRLVNAGYGEYGSGPEGNGGPGNGGPGNGGPGNGGGHGGSAGTGGGAPGNSGGAELNGDEFSTTGFIGPDFAGLQRHLVQALDASKQLSLDVQPDSVRISSNNGPARDYPFGDTFTRIDEYGTARIDSRWSGQILEVRARYSSHATLTERYSGDAHAGTLTVLRELTDPVAGKLTVRSVYRK